MSLSAQAKVLRALQENKITRVGGEKEIKVNVRVIAATNKDLLKEIDEGNFRMDLYHRLSVILIHVPPLKERQDDIPGLATHFCKEICEEYGFPIKQITDEAMKALQNLPWSGNIRELRNVIERMIILSDKVISENEVFAYANPAGNANGLHRQELNDALVLNYADLDSLDALTNKAQENYLRHHWKKHQGDVPALAKAIGCSENETGELIKKFKL
jgi:two-component system nitrogen regulation response regulator NtrX